MSEQTVDAPRPRDIARAAQVMCALAVRAAPGAALVATLSMISITSAFPIASLALGVFTDAAVARNLGLALAVSVALGGFNVVTRGGQAVAMRARMQLREQTLHELDLRMMDLTSEIPGLAHLERAEDADRIQLLRWQRQFLAYAPDGITFLFAMVIWFFATGAVLLRISPWLTALPLCGIPALIATVQVARRMERVQEELAEERRLAGHFADMVTRPAVAPEMRVFGLGAELRDRHDRLGREVIARLRTVSIRNQLLVSLAWLVFAVGFGGAVVFVVQMAISGRASAGDVVTTITLTAGVRVFLEQAATFSSTTYQSLKAAQRYLWLADRHKAEREAARPAAPEPAPTVLRDGIRFDGVSFTYPGTEVEVLRDVDLFFPAGSTVAIVGDNGAGKSTIVKLLARFYEPASGTITIDGVPLASIPADDWRQRLSAGFQDFVKPELIACEAIGLGDVTTIEDLDVVAAAVERAAAREVIEDLPDGLATQLGRKFDGGVELSGGQWQRVALSRAMMRPSPLLLLLDEPTAALDAQAEEDLFLRYAGAAAQTARAVGAITILVSHRFSTVRMADQIVVVEGGRVTEVGDHRSLVDLGGTYSELFEMQARSYR